MPFIQRIIQPQKLSKHRKTDRSLFEDFDEVTSFTLVKVLKQLSSLCYHAENIFGELHNETSAFCRRCKIVSEKIKTLQVRVDAMDAERVLIPVSDLDIERSIPAYLQYHSPNSVEEDLFTADSRIPCVIHLHHRTRQDFDHLLRGSDAYAKSRPKSMDPKMLMEELSRDEMDTYFSQSPRNSSFIPTPAQINSRIEQEHDLQPSSSDQKMRIDPWSSNTDIIKVDKSGENFVRQANLSRSQRFSSCSSSVRHRSNASQKRQLRYKHKTLVGLPGGDSADTGGGILRPYSLHSDVIGNSYFEGSSDGSRSINEQVTSPRQNLRNAEIQTDDVKVLTLTPSQRRMKQKGIGKNQTSPASSQARKDYIESTRAIGCPKVPMMKQTSTPINGLHVGDIIRPTTLDVKINDASTDEGRHTGESNPSTPVRTGTPHETSPQLKKLQSPDASDNNGNHSNNNNNGKKLPNSLAMRMNGGTARQGEDRASSGCWSGTESAQHSSSSDITTQHAPVMNALQHMLNKEKHSPISIHSAGQISPIISNRPLASDSVASTSSASISSKLSAVDAGKSKSLYKDDDERFQSPSSSVVNVITLNRSNNVSTSSLNSTASDGGTAISAAAMLRKSRKSRLNGTGGAYNFMNYDVDPIGTGANEVSRVVKSRRSTRSVKNRGFKKRSAAEDTVSMTSMADSSPQNTDVDALSAHSGGGRLMADSASLCESMFSVDQEGYYTSMHDDCGISKSATPCTVPETVFFEEKSSTPTAIIVVPPAGAMPASPVVGKRDVAGDEVDARNNYNSYNRAVKSNHSTPKSLLSPRSASVKTPKHVDPPALDFQSELNKRLSVRRPADKKLGKKGKRGAPPPPPKRASSLSGSSSPSPSPSIKSLSEKESLPEAPAASLGIMSTPPSQKPSISPEEFYKTTPPPPPPIDALPPPPPELLTPENKTSIASPETKDLPPPVPRPNDYFQASPTEANAPRSPPSSLASNPSPIQAIAMQAALLGSRFSEKKKSAASAEVKSGGKEISAPAVTTPEKVKVVKSPKLGSSKAHATAESVKPHSTAAKIPPHTAPKTWHVTPPVAPKTTFVPPEAKHYEASAHHVSPVVKSPPPVAPKTSSVPPAAKPCEEAAYVSPVVKSPPLVAPKTTSVPPAAKPYEAAAHISPVAKSPPPVASKTASVPPATKLYHETSADPPVVKSPPPTGVKTTALPHATKVAPPVAPKTASIPPTGKVLTKSSAEEPAPNQTVGFSPPAVAPKPSKIPLISSAPDEEDEAGTENVVKTAGEAASKVEISCKPEETAPPLAAEVTPNAPEYAAEHDSAGAPDSVDWLEKIEEISGPGRGEQDSNCDVAPELSAVASKPEQNAKASRPTFESMMLALHKSKREPFSGKPASSSPPSSPGANGEVFTHKANGSKSPASTLERKRNGRLSSNGGIRSGGSRKSTGGTSRDNFKALLLQNACRGTSGSHMTAAEKLKRNKPSAAAALSKQRPNSMKGPDGNVSPEEDATDVNEGDSENARETESLDNVRTGITSGAATTSRVGRTGKRGQMSAAAELAKYATFSAQSKKQHPPPSLSSKYNTRSRTPTRPMMSISEDSETEKSPEQALAKTRAEEG